MPYEPSLDELRKRTWDIAVIGTGMGGATVGYGLARRGLSVIFLERGYSLLNSLAADEAGLGPEETLLREGWWPTDLSHHDGSGVHSFRHPLGCGTGGSSAIFGMIMERFRPEDFRPRRWMPEAGSSTVPDEWPIQYEDLEKYYGEAERLYRVHGTSDPLLPETANYLPPPPPSDKERVFLTGLAECGLHPYRFHYACERVPECNSCPGRLCTRNCRNDAHRMCLVPALQNFGASLLSRCHVERLECENRNVREVLGVHQGQEVRIKASVVILAANTFVSPLILLRSRTRGFPNGLANGSGVVGKNLMLHVSDSLLVRRSGVSLSRLRPLDDPMNHGIGINDFYLIDGIKHGNIHAHPITVSAESVKAYLTMRHPRVAKAMPRGISLIARAGAILHAEKTYFSTIVEDLPYAENRVLADQSTGDRVAYAYTVTAELRKRAETLVERFTRAIAERFRVTVVGRPGQLNLSHACGTLRFANDPRDSVLDATNRAHELDNLYVVDASFFPSSGGLNPSLTIAANALRVAEIISANRPAAHHQALLH